MVYSVQEFTQDSNFAVGFVDRLLDTITDGAHSKMLKQQKVWSLLIQ